MTKIETPGEVVQFKQEQCKEMWEKRLDALPDDMGDKERNLLAEAASTIGRKWPRVIPYNQPLRLSNYDVATDLAYRLQVTPKDNHCT